MAKQWWARFVVGRTAVSDPLQEPDRSDPRFELEWRTIVRTRLVVVLGVMILWAAGLEARLIWLQGVQHDTFVKLAESQQFDLVPADAVRGDVRDRNGQLLAVSVESFDIKANPFLVKDAVAEAGELCAALGDCTAADRAQLVATFNKKKVKDVVVRQAITVSPDMTTRVRALLTARSKALKGASKALVEKLPAKNALWLERHSVRFYPKMDVAAHVVGFLKADGKGAAGVEAQFDTKLSGVKGRVLRQVDGNTDELLTRVERAPVPGDSIELTIDARLQQIADRELRAGVTATGAKGGSAIMFDPYTGEILALSSYPTFNPNAPLEGVSDEQRRNRAIVDIYEPGSTFKMVTASAALNEHVFTPSMLIDTNPGIIRFGSRVIDEDKGHNYHVLSFEDVIVKSSNVGAVKIGLQVGADRMRQYMRRFGFGQRIAPDFGGEAVGIVSKAQTISDGTLASWSMGYEVGVTPIQMVAAAAAVANGGLLMEPHLVRAYVRDGRREEVAPKVVRRAISEETALELTGIMEGVVALPQGTGSAARMVRYQVAGKTGTAAKFEDHHYSKTNYNVSFVGFVPSRKPVYAILVVVDAPSVGPAYGGRVAAPIFHRIAEAALEYAGVAPTINPTAPVIVAGDRPLFQPPAPFEMPVLTNIGGRPVMPDLRGMSLRDATRVTVALGLTMSSDGDGVVVSQTPSPGEFLAESGRGTLQLRRPAAKTTGGNR